MKVYFHINEKDLEYLNKILKDSNNLEDPINISYSVADKNQLMVSVTIDDFIRLGDIDAFNTIIHL